jgi:hypothetical protein
MNRDKSHKIQVPVLVYGVSSKYRGYHKSVYLIPGETPVQLTITRTPDGITQNEIPIPSIDRPRG